MKKFAVLFLSIAVILVVGIPLSTSVRITFIDFDALPPVVGLYFIIGGAVVSLTVAAIRLRDRQSIIKFVLIRVGMVVIFTGILLGIIRWMSWQMDQKYSENSMPSKASTTRP